MAELGMNEEVVTVITYTKTYSKQRSFLVSY